MPIPPISTVNCARRSLLTHFRAGSGSATSTLLVLIIAAAGLLGSGKSQAQERWNRAPTQLVSVEYENDLFARRDSWYTNGFRVTWGDNTTPLPDWLAQTARAFPLFPETDDPILWGVSLGQAIFTPRDISDPEYPPDDRPYAGWLGLGAHLAAIQPGRMDRLVLLAGTVGPASGAERTQHFVHDITGSEPPVGWDTQLPNEASLILAYDHARTSMRGDIPDSQLSWEFMPSAGGVIGNTVIEARTGFLHRIGMNIPRDFGPPRMSHVPIGSALFEPTGETGWYAFWGISARYVVHNIFLDGSLVQDTPSVEKKPIVGEIYSGLAVQWGQNRLSYTHVLRSREFDTQEKAETYGTLSFSWMF